MSRLWYFYPENDCALAANTGSYTASAAAVGLRHGGELLPLFLADSSDAVICSGVNAEWFDNFRHRFSIEADIWDHSTEGFMPTPWGWSPAVRRYFLNLGFSPEALPSEEDVNRMRELSHRRTAAAVADYIEKSTDLPLWPRAVEVSDALVLRRLLEDMTLAVVKQPWSSSGRGVRYFDAARMSVDTFIGQTVGTIARQGSVMVERFMPEHHDFALLFRCNHGKVESVGPSVFISGNGAANYGGNIVAPDSHLRSLISEFIDPVQFDELTSAVAAAIEAVIAPAYDGPVGVDICASGGLIHICETNLRYTMGFVARGIATHSDVEGILTSTDRTNENDILLTPPGVATKFVVRR